MEMTININTIKEINFSEMFIKTHDEIYSKIKNYTNCKIKKYKTQERYLTLLSFVENSCYWTRFNRNAETHKYNKNFISGKYLNEIHLSLIKCDFYNMLHKKLLDIYFELTNYETINTVSQDSTFVRNILALKCKRNPQYYNKPGLKIHAIVDTLRTPISLHVSDCTDHDSRFIKELIDKKIIANDNFYKECHTFLADSAYNTESNIIDLTSGGMDVIFGRNKQHIKKGTMIENATTGDIRRYKKRGISENFFGIIERYPCIINVYEKTQKSYEGLITFVACSILAKKINNIIAEKNDTNIKQKRETRTLEKKRELIKRTELRKLERLKEKKIKDEQDKQIKERDIQNNIKINNIIKNHIDTKILKRIYNKKKANLVNIKNISLYKKYEKKIINNIINHVRNNVLMCTKTFKFAGKPAYITIIDKHAFADTGIEHKMIDEKNNIILIINDMVESFFDRYVQKHKTDNAQGNNNKNIE